MIDVDRRFSYKKPSFYYVNKKINTGQHRYTSPSNFLFLFFKKMEVIFWEVGEELLLVLVIIIQNDYTGGAQNLLLPFLFLFCYYYVF
jgi:hypothetical protein